MKNKNWFFIAAVLFLALALWQEVAPVLGPNREKLLAASKEIKRVEGFEVASMLRDPPHKPAVLFIYASWCSYCREMMPDLLAELAPVAAGKKLVFVSIDEKPRNLVTYLFDNGYLGKFTPYMINENGQDALRRAISGSGGGFSGGVPYMAIFDANGHMVDEQQGIAGRERLKQLLK